VRLPWWNPHCILVILAMVFQTQLVSDMGRSFDDTDSSYITLKIIFMLMTSWYAKNVNINKVFWLGLLQLSLRTTASRPNQKTKKHGKFKSLGVLFNLILYNVIEKMSPYDSPMSYSWMSEKIESNLTLNSLSKSKNIYLSKASKIIRYS
jgi:hypothetical protein